MDAPNPRDQQTAVAEGRRIYLGNLLYATRPNEIEQVLQDSGFGNFAQIHISVDPVSGRNPGYCFVDFNDRETADAALAGGLVATIGGRTLRVGPCQPKQPKQASDGSSSSTAPRRDTRSLAERWGAREAPSPSPTPTPTPPPGGGGGEDRRWGDWKRGTDGRNGTATGSGPRQALDHFSAVFNNGGGGGGGGVDTMPSGGRRLYIGGLGSAPDHAQHLAELEALLAGLAPVAIGKRITARDRATNQTRPGQNYCFVDFATADAAAQAMQALNGQAYGEEGRTLHVSPARGTPESGRVAWTADESRGAGAGAGDGYRKRTTAPAPAPDGPPRALSSSNWRRKD